MAPKADCSTPSPSLQLGHMGRSSSQELKENAPQEQHAGEYDNILSSPSIVNNTQGVTERTADIIAISSALEASEEDSHAEALRVNPAEKTEDRPSIVVTSERQSTEMQRFSMLASSQVQNDSKSMALASEAYQTTVLSPEEAVNTSLDQNLPIVTAVEADDHKE